MRSGDALLAPSITRRLVERFARGTSPRRPSGPARDLSGLTPRELEVLGLIARGLSNAELAAGADPERGDGQDPRGPDPGQVELRDRVQAVVLAYETGLVSPGADG